MPHEVDDDLLIKFSPNNPPRIEDAIGAASNRNERLVGNTFQKSSLVLDGD